MAAFGLFLLGTVILIAGAELVVRGSANLAVRLGISPLIIGLTVVAIGTSTPELAVAIDAGIEGKGSLAVGNVAGTNVINILLILGISAFLAPLALHLRVLRLDLPVTIVATLGLLAAASDRVITRTESVVLAAGAILYTLLVIGAARKESQDTRAEFERELAAEGVGRPRGSIIRSTFVLLLGIPVTVVGSIWLVDGAVELAQSLGVSDAFIGLTVVAIGTSTPEIATAVVATLRRARDVAVGNLLGSGIYNILFILGVAGLFPSAGLEVDRDVARVDIPVMLVVAVVCVPVFITGRTVTRLEGGGFVAAYLAYLAYLLIART